jgi:glycoside/pentoside/hexuronide:cation symporter, GPH family
VTPLAASSRPNWLQISVYAAGSLGTGVFSTVPTVLLLYYCTNILFLRPELATLIVFVPKAWSVLWDPLVGSWSDRTRGRLGRRRPFLIVGAAGVTISFIALFSTPSNLSGNEAFAWVAVSYFVLATVYSAYAVPYIAIPAEASDDPVIRARMVGARMTVAMAGVLLGAGAAPFVVELAGGGRAGYETMAWIVAIACGCAMFAPVIGIRRHERIFSEKLAPRPRLAGQIRRATASSHFRRIAVAYFIQLTSIAAFFSAVPYLVTGHFGRQEGDVGLAMTLLLIATMAAVPLWVRIARRTGAIRALRFAVILGAVTIASVGICTVSGVAWTTALLTFPLVGLAFAGLQVLPFTLAADVAHNECRNSGQSDEAVFTGLWTATEKLALAAGPGLTGLALSLVAPRSDEFELYVAIIPPVLCALSLLVIRDADLVGIRRSSSVHMRTTS